MFQVGQLVCSPKQRRIFLVLQLNTTALFYVGCSGTHVVQLRKYMLTCMHKQTCSKQYYK